MYLFNRLSGYTSDNNGTMKNSRVLKKSPASRTRLSLPKEQPTSSSSLKYNVIINPLPLDQIHLIWRDVFVHR